MCLQNQLRTQSRSSLPRVEASRRTMVLAWRENDTVAEELCQAISPAFCLLYRAFRVLDELDLTMHLRDMITIGQEAPIYLVWVWGQSDAPDLHHIKQLLQNLPQSVIIDVCRVNDTADAWPVGYRCGYHLNSNIEQAADALVSLFMLESAGRELLNLPADRQIFHLSARLYNSIEEDLIRQLAGRLDSLLKSAHESWDQCFTDAFGPTRKDMERLYQSLPQPTDLPIPGAEGLANQHVNITVQEALKIFFGESDNIAMPEYLRSVLSEQIPSRCNRYLSGLAVRERYYQQPLDILQNGRYLTSRHQKIIRDKREKLQEECREILRQEFTPRGTAFQALLDAMGDYFEIWKKCVCCEIEAAWWDEIDKLFDPNSQIMEEVNEYCERFSRGLQIVRACGLDLDLESGGAATGNVLDWRGKTPVNILCGLSSQAAFSQDDIVRMIQDAQRQADRQLPVAGISETWILYGGELADLQGLENQGEPIFNNIGQGLAFRGAGGHLRVLSFQDVRAGMYNLWEIHITQ